MICLCVCVCVCVYISIIVCFVFLCIYWCLFSNRTLRVVFVLRVQDATVQIYTGY